MFFLFKNNYFLAHMHGVPIPDDFIKAMILCNCHIGGATTTKKFERYVYQKRKDDGISVISVKETINKMIVAARVFLAIPDPSTVVVLSNKISAKKPILKFCEATGATPSTGRFIPGSFTNQFLSSKKEPRLVILSDSFADAQTALEATYVNTPCIAFVNSDNLLNFVDVAIPVNNRSSLSIGCAFYIFGKIIRYMKGLDNFETPIGGEIEYYFYRYPLEIETIAGQNTEPALPLMEVEEEEESTPNVENVAVVENNDEGWGTSAAAAKDGWN